MILDVPAKIKARDSPITPSPVILPLAVLQALSTTNSALRLSFKISAAVSAIAFLRSYAKEIKLSKPSLSFSMLFLMPWNKAIAKKR